MVMVGLIIPGNQKQLHGGVHEYVVKMTDSNDTIFHMTLLLGARPQFDASQRVCSISR